MEAKPAYPTETPYGIFSHRELSVSWLVIATLLGSRHRLEADFLDSSFGVLEFGCGYGLNLIFNAAAHPRARFYGVDLNASHIAEATARARELGLDNVEFALADLTDFAAGTPRVGPCRHWPESYDIVAAHGVASWVGSEVRQALVAAAGSLLRPGGLFYCSYNTYPGWLPRSPLQMLAMEEALRAGGQTSRATILKAGDLLGRLTGEEQQPWPLGRALPALRGDMNGLTAMPAEYLPCEYHAGHQPLYVGPMHRLCAVHGLTHIGSASLPEMFPELLDPGRKSLVMEAADPPMREVLLDLATNQTFRRDLFAKGTRKPSSTWRREALAGLQLRWCAAPGDGSHVFENSLGQFTIDSTFLSGLKESLAGDGRALGELVDLFSLDLDDLVQRLSILAHAGVIALSFPGGDAADPDQGAIAAFNRRWLERTTGGDAIPYMLSPVLRQPVSLPVLEAFFLQTSAGDLSDDEAVQLVWMGLTMAGGFVNDAEGTRIEDPQRALEALHGFRQTFLRDRLPVLRRLGIAPAAPSAP
jgi:SAM-dependent methyltransferase